LHGSDDDSFKRTEGLFKSGKRDDVTSSRTVGIRDDEAFLERRRVKRPLLLDDRKMGWIYMRYNKGDVGISTVVFGI